MLKEHQMVRLPILLKKVHYMAVAITTIKKMKKSSLKNQRRAINIAMTMMMKMRDTLDTKAAPEMACLMMI
jgi:hypothetical protein